MTIRPRAARVWLTAGTTGWARAPYDPDRDPTLAPDPTRRTEPLEPATMSIDHTLTPADVAARCGTLGCGVVVAGSNYKITPPADATTEDGSRPSVVHVPADPDFRSKADRALSIRNLRHNGVNVLADRDWSAPSADPETGPEIPKLELNGKRPTLTYDRTCTADDQDDHDAATAAEAPEDTEAIVARLGDAMARVVAERLAPLTDEIAKVNARIDALETRPAGAQRLGQLDETVGSLARRVAGLEHTNQQIAEGLDAARTAISKLDERLANADASVRAVSVLANEHHDRLAALETGTPVPAAPKPRVARTREVADEVAEAMKGVPANMPVPIGSIVDLLGGLSDEDVSILRHGALPELVRSGRILRVGKGAGTRYSAITEEN